MSNGTIDPDSLAGKLIEMQELMDNQCNELISSRARVHELTNRNKELEERACLLQRDLAHAHEQLTKYQRDLKESQAQKEDQEERISTLEKRYLYIQKETTHLTEFNSRLENELATKETQLMHVSRHSLLRPPSATVRFTLGGGKIPKSARKIRSVRTKITISSGIGGLCQTEWHEYTEQSQRIRSSYLFEQSEYGG